MRYIIYRNDKANHKNSLVIFLNCTNYFHDLLKKEDSERKGIEKRKPPAFVPKAFLNIIL